jgi:two-component system, NarL family, nitrate/nitrite response regulator NarL
MNSVDMTAKRTRILLVDDHTIFRQALANLLAREPDLTVEFECGSVLEALLFLTTGHPDLVLLDIDLGNQRGSDFLVSARRGGFNGPVIVLTAGIPLQEEVSLLQSGVAGVLRKDVSVELLCAAIREAVRSYVPGFQYTGPDRVDLRSREVKRVSLTAREMEVLRLVIEGSGNKEIAGELACSESAIKGVVQQLFHKTGTNTRSQLVRVALERYGPQTGDPKSTA